ncbi:MAG: MBL fold metallo-hydrolase [Promethearchaeia archaeon]
MRNGNIPFSNAFLVEDHLFDTGISPIRLRHVQKNFSIKKIIFSHWHDDHIRDNKRLGTCRGIVM